MQKSHENLLANSLKMVTIKYKSLQKESELPSLFQKSASIVQYTLFLSFLLYLAILRHWYDSVFLWRCKTIKKITTKTWIIEFVHFSTKKSDAVLMSWKTFIFLFDKADNDKFSGPYHIIIDRNPDFILIILFKGWSAIHRSSGFIQRVIRLKGRMNWRVRSFWRFGK